MGAEGYMLTLTGTFQNGMRVAASSHYNQCAGLYSAHALLKNPSSLKRITKVYQQFADHSLSLKQHPI